MTTEQQLQQERELSDALAGALEPFMKDDIYDGDNTSTLIGAVRKCRAVLAQYTASRSEGTATPK